MLYVSRKKSEAKNINSEPLLGVSNALVTVIFNNLLFAFTYILILDISFFRPISPGLVLRVILGLRI